MKSNRSNICTAVVSVLAFLALAALLGYPIIPPEAFAGLGMVPLAMAGETSMDDITEMLKKQNEGLEQWKRKHDGQLERLSSDVLDLAKKQNRPFNPATGAGGEPSAGSETWFDAKTQNPVRVLSHKHSLAALDKKTGDGPSVGRLLRGIVMGSRASDAKALEEERKAMGVSAGPSGGYTVQDALAGEWIDLLRANMVLSQAGARTVPMPAGTLHLARVLGDPTVTWHNENAALTGSEPTLGQITLNARTVVCLVKMSLELSQDSANIEQILQSSITSAMATAIDGAGLVGVTEGEGVAPGGVTGLADRNKVLSIGAPTNWDFVTDGMYELLADNVPMDGIGAMVAHPALWRKMSKLKTGISGDNTPLAAPPEVGKLPKLWTTAAPLSGGTTATGVIADWRDLLFGVRKDIEVRVLQETFMGSNLQIAMLAYARVDFAATRHQSFCTLEGITVA